MLNASPFLDTFLIYVELFKNRMAFWKYHCDLKNSLLKKNENI